MKAVSIVALREKRGSPHFWLENQSATRSGFMPGEHFNLRPYRMGVLLELADQGERTVSRKTKGASLVPIIDINSREALGPLVGHEVVRVVFGDRAIYVTPPASEIRRQRRLRRLRAHLEDKVVETGGVACGGGILSHALHAGLSDAGLSPTSRLANEIRVDVANHAFVHNESFSEETVFATMPLQELAFDEEVMARLPEIDVLELGLPCSGASSAGRAKNAISLPEAHPFVGHLVAGAVAIIAKLNPVCIVLENVPNYARSASAAILRTQLADMGYSVSERILVGTDWGELEARQRWFLVAMTRGVGFDFEALQPGEQRVRYLAEIMDAVPVDDPSWSRMQYLRDKEVRDREAGKGFRMQVFDGSEIAISTLTKGLHKRRSTDPFFVHPEDPDLLRLPTVGEHARCKGVPEHLVAGLPQSIGHEVLGQSIVYGPVRAMARHIGEALLRFEGVEIHAAAMRFSAAA